MSFFDTAAIFNYHRQMIDACGPQSSLALGWKDRESQRSRFRALATIGELNNRSVLDVGCGYGDLLPYLAARCNRLNYTGVEQIPELLHEAIKRYGDHPEASFIHGDFTTMQLTPADYVFASGSLNYRSVDPEFIFKIITKFYGACRIAFAFNLLSDIVPNGMLVAYDPDEINAYCNKLCNNVKLLKGYAADDFTVFMYR
ncbi:class I SAM-dependent methyltransferase [Mucilaginibacter xinganensis]|uniref:Trans-aconitate 2-methyltransferase n=1 Tax=Mucilaginibacter xinganensis TaxID=1234841 RepID=A0A223NXV1_9SPHI|nr:class I SAM-dependent methyltransferase [Mucilaginibacter xinganensis]ASU34693.1 Trans-aconitate 2-methyltransferase [Mucilaginibacter xinganensis]